MNPTKFKKKPSGWLGRGYSGKNRPGIKNKDGRHYWLTPPELMGAFKKEFRFTFDACPFPRPKSFDGLLINWGKRTYVNPPFYGPTAWVRKAIAEQAKGKTVVFVFPTDKWIHYLLKAGAEMRSLGDVKWCAIEDGKPGKGIGRYTMAFILRGRPSNLLAKPESTGTILLNNSLRRISMENTGTGYETIGNYKSTPLTQEWIGEVFSFGTPNKGHQAKLKEIEKAARTFAEVIVKAIPGSENLTVLKRVKQTMFAAGAALQYNGLAV